MFEISETIEGDIATIKISGDMIDAAALGLAKSVKKLSEKNIKNIVLDLGEVKLVNSCFGLGIITACWGCLNRSGGQLKIANPNQKVLHILEITKLDQVLNIFESVDAAKTALRTEHTFY